MNVVFLNPSGQIGGAERSLLDILASLRAAQPDWTLRLLVTADGPLVAAAEALGVGTTVVPLPPALARLGDGGAGGSASPLALARALPSGAEYLRRLRRAVAELSPDVLHTNGFKMHVLGVWAGRGVPVVWHVHDFVGRRPLMSRLLRAHARGCAGVVANSDAVAADVRRVCGERFRAGVRTVHNAVDLRAFSPDGPGLELDARAGLPPAPSETVRVGLVATLAWWKGHETFLRAVSLLPPDLPVRAYVVGGALYETAGSQRSLDDLRGLARRLGVDGRVGFTGYVEDAAAAMRALDVVVHASTEPEPFGLVIVEAMACGRAVVVSQAGGAAELIHAEEDALGHAPGDAGELARRIEELVRDGALRARLGAAGRAAAERRFDRARLAAELVPVYRAATGAVS
ncbi:MAG TPA: glycosyltransferase [Longimicrobiaceae bacterium]|nr:glycosyltransferase [Longimicrobiaceae bacterium]